MSGDKEKENRLRLQCLKAGTYIFLAPHIVATNVAIIFRVGTTTSHITVPGVAPVSPDTSSPRLLVPRLGGIDANAMAINDNGMPNPKMAGGSRPISRISRFRRYNREIFVTSILDESPQCTDNLRGLRPFIEAPGGAVYVGEQVLLKLIAV